MGKLFSCILAAALVVGYLPPLHAGARTDAGCWGIPATEFCIDEDGNVSLGDNSLSLDGGLVVNEDSGDYDSRIESDDNAAAFYLDAGNSRVGIHGSTPAAALDVKANVATDTALQVSGLASQAVDIVDVRSNEDTRMFRIDADGGVMVVDGSASPSSAVDAGDLYVEEKLEVDGSLDVSAGVATNTGLLVAGVASQAVDIVDVRSNEDTRMFRIDADGGVMIVDGDASPTTAVDAGDLYIEEQLEVDGAVDFDNTLSVENTITGYGNVNFNENGLADIFFRMEGDTGAYLIYAQGSTDRVGIHDSTPDAALDVNPIIASDTALLVNGLASQVGDIINARSNEDTTFFRVGPTGGGQFIVLTEAGCDSRTPDFAGELVQVSNFSTTGLGSWPYALCINTSGVAGEYYLVGNTTTVGCGASNDSD